MAVGGCGVFGFGRDEPACDFCARSLVEEDAPKDDVRTDNALLYKLVRGEKVTGSDGHATCERGGVGAVGRVDEVSHTTIISIRPSIASTTIIIIEEINHVDDDAPPLRPLGARLHRRRLAVRPAHLENAQRLIKTGVLRVAGGLLTPDSILPTTPPTDKKLVGSCMIYEAESLEGARELVEQDEYYKNGVWDKEKLVILPIGLVTALAPVPSSSSSSSS
ncbi:hypothetical protein F5I97DRAFT_1827818 [Phlebopus sp. FC_14]|nr:hypothetical protein F5I97DRAFT_1827818 [Phlebopus sp. FC_14]